MNALILGGNSPHNQEWIQQVQTTLAPLFEKIELHDYAHWASSQNTIDFEHELRTVQRQVRSLGQYVVFAKSVGVLLCLRGMAENIIRPEKIILLGTPLNFVKQQTLEHDFQKWLGKVTEPVLVIQNSRDPVATASETEHFYKSHLSPSLITFAELPGESHDYIDFPKLSELVGDFLAAQPASA